jgi:hypothetical protein
VKAIFDIAALPNCDIRSMPTGADSGARFSIGWLAANLRIGDGVARDATAIGRRESQPGSRMLPIHDRNRIAGHGRRESCSISEVA